MHKILFYNKFITCLYMFRALCAHHQEVKIILYSIWYHHTETSEWFKCPYMFRALCAQSSGGQNCIIQHLVSTLKQVSALKF